MIIGSLIVINNLLNSYNVNGTGHRTGAAIFVSGAGSNAERLLETREKFGGKWIPLVIVTDFPEKSRAAEIARRFGLPLAALSIKEFYLKHGETSATLLTESGRRIREMWTGELREKLSQYDISFGILAGFVSLSNITGDFPCLNVHPGDLTLEEDGRRALAGLHAVPIEKAILRGLTTLRSSVILAQPYTGAGGEMDTGPTLGVSPACEVDMMGAEVGKLREIAASRPPQKPRGGYRDLLETIALHNQERLKSRGDWIVFPPAVADFASGKFGYDQASSLCYDNDGKWVRIRAIEYSPSGRKLISLNQDNF
jgi:folate-dependent phosphoribosylglycinamide formyltransferase PurN